MVDYILRYHDLSQQVAIQSAIATNTDAVNVLDEYMTRAAG